MQLWSYAAYCDLLLRYRGERYDFTALRDGATSES